MGDVISVHTKFGNYRSYRMKRTKLFKKVIKLVNNISTMVTRGMSPIVGIILMLLITVIVIGAFFTGVQDIIQKIINPAPNTILDIKINKSKILLIRNLGGDEIDLRNINIIVTSGLFREIHKYPFLYDDDGILSVGDVAGVQLNMSLNVGDIVNVKVVHIPSQFVIFDRDIIVGVITQPTQTLPTPPNSSYLVFNVNKNKWYRTIGDAIGDADNGNRILVYPNYNVRENLIINKNLKIEAVEIGKAKIDGYVRIESSNVTLKGFDINDYIYIYNKNYRLSHNIISHNIIHHYVRVRDAENITISHNTVNVSYNYGIEIKDCANIKIESNTLNGLGTRWGIIRIYGSNNVIVNSNRISTDSYGIYAYNTPNLLIEANDIRSNDYGIKIKECTGAIIKSNNVYSNGAGIYVYGGTNDTIEDNYVDRSQYGIWLKRSQNCIITKNKIINSTSCSIQLNRSENNLIYNNVFNSNRNVCVKLLSNIWNVTKTSGTNIIGGNYLGGNAWMKPDGSGFSQTCSDSDDDGICDTPYVINSRNIDYLPLKD